MSPLDRRRLLRAAAALGATGSLAAACSPSGDGDASASGPASPHAPASPRASATAVGHTAGGVLAALPASLPFEISRGPAARKQVALTFHGQGDPKLATALLAEAERQHARITVMAVGTWLDEQPQLARRILDGGHELGNHTEHHRAIGQLTPDQQYAEIDACAQRLKQLTGSIGRWFRPSQAQDCTASVAAQARRVGYTHCLSYDLDSLDWTDPGADAVTRTVLSGVRPGSVVSMHFGHPGTLAALPAILDGLDRRGMRAVTTTELLT